MCYYCKVSPNEQLHLSDNKRPAAIILLAGHLIIYKKEVQTKPHKKNNFNNGKK